MFNAARTSNLVQNNSSQSLVLTSEPLENEVGVANYSAATFDNDLNITESTISDN